jgi:4-hydroxybutyrate CoA-transferase
MDYKKIYQEKLCSAEEIAKRVQSGWVLGLDSGPVATPAIIDAIIKRAKTGEIDKIKVHNMLDYYPFDFYYENLLGKIESVSWFSGPGSRNAVNSGFGDFGPAYFHEIPTIYRKFYDFDVFITQVSPMDKHGYMSLGICAASSAGLLDKSKRIFVEVNENMPRACGGINIHVKDIDGIVENHIPVPTLEPSVIDDTSRKIGELIAEQIPDGACIQLGIGAIPDATGMALKSKKDLGLHTEMFTGSMVDLIECGAVNNSKKQIHRYKSVCTFAYGPKSMYEYVDDNPSVLFLPVEYVNDPNVIAQNDNVISINACIEVDLWGQVCSESIGTKHFSGTGGQVDYVRGAPRSKGGKSFIAFQSTAKNGTISKIRSSLSEGAICTTNKNEVDYIVTEYGIAHLRGQPISSRAKQLIQIAHPDFRDELTFAARKRGMLI